MLQRLLYLTCNILDEVDASDDRYGDDVRTFVNTTGDTFRCRIDQTKEMEYEVNRDTRKTMFRLFLEPEALGHVNAKSRIYIIEQDVTYEVFGEPTPLARRNRIDHLELKLRILEG